jgi:hypothetical protein
MGDILLDQMLRREAKRRTMIPHKKLHDKDFEELIDIYGTLRFGSSMLPNRTLNAFNNFVQTGIFDNNSEEYKFLDAYNKYSCEVKISEFERLRRWFIIFMLFEYSEEEIGEVLQ